MRKEERTMSSLLGLYSQIELEDASAASAAAAATRGADGCFRRSGGNPVEDRHLEFLSATLPKSVDIYEDDGDPVIFAFKGTGGIKCCGYRWSPASAVLEEDPEHFADHGRSDISFYGDSASAAAGVRQMANFGSAKTDRSPSGNSPSNSLSFTSSQLSPRSSPRADFSPRGNFSLRSAFSPKSVSIGNAISPTSPAASRARRDLSSGMAQPTSPANSEPPTTCYLSAAVSPAGISPVDRRGDTPPSMAYGTPDCSVGSGSVRKWVDGVRPFGGDDILSNELVRPGDRTPENEEVPFLRGRGLISDVPGYSPRSAVALPSTPSRLKGQSVMGGSVLEGHLRRLYWGESWTPIDWTKVKGVLLHAHGITENARTGMIRIKATEQILGPNDHIHTGQLTELQQLELKRRCEGDEGCSLVFRKSWVDYLINAGYVVYAIDNQGHGYSQGWRGDRCNVERLAHMEEDIVQLIRSLIASGEVPSSVPFFISGLSLGGLITARALEIGFERKLLTTRPVTRGPGQEMVNPADAAPMDPAHVVPMIDGWVLLCPAISGERLKKKFPNQILLPVMHVISAATPSLRAASLQNVTPFPFISELIARDPLVFDSKLPIRISAESVIEMDRVLPSAMSLPPELPVFLIQSRFDTMTDPEGSALFMDTIRCQDKTSFWLNYSWHWLGKEPGYGSTISTVIEWLDRHVKKRPADDQQQGDNEEPQGKPNN